MNKLNDEINNSMLIYLDEWSFVTVKGEDSKQYLHSQLTADINNLNLDQHVFTAHCESNGKILGLLHLFFYQEGFGYIIRSSIADKQIDEFKKYSIFSKVIFKKETNVVLLGVIGLGASKTLRSYFANLPSQKHSVLHCKETTLLYFHFHTDRFLILTNSKIAFKLKKIFSKFGDNRNWILADIESGFANIDLETCKKFTPQDINLDILSNGVSFKKGCYIGQENIMRMRYRGIKKRSMFQLFGISNFIPNPGEFIECCDSRDQKRWFRVGVVLIAAKLIHDICVVQAVINNYQKNNIFRLSGDLKSRFLVIK